ncbi:MAG: hypothetical protein AAGF20_07375 [Pseudomonadota bacterium]
MRDLRDNLGNVWRTASRLTSKSGGARAVMFVSARDQEGTSSVAASFALLAARRVQKQAWLVDLDLRRNSVFKAFERGFAKHVGRPGRAFDASLRQKPIYSIVPSLAGGRDQKLLTAHEIDQTRLLVTRFRNEHLRQGQRVQIRTAPDWWAALRRVADWIIVDAPSLERSPASLAMASQVDGVILVVEADVTRAEDVVAARREIEAYGGEIVGVVMNQVGSDARFADRFG